ncbi:radical SAM protein [Egibacter rhizosphaerae]|uniref:Probable dual-specificity RNA methyltransferase RlmN n=1 Tax=Egibacter rhizosphaerae TaxID=1670831 RepID=A0A411YCL3_9ACTN|nr:23S rRNA (adenine(2503)-C(2))-methyltransferase RlmN [Egibacter rhizosphaerae]QBI18954.1 radical SAM protein [Egibacter rhizosphaerae]
MAASPRIDPYRADDAALASAFGDEPPYRVRQVRSWLARGVDDPHAMTDLPKELRARLAQRLVPAPPVLAHRTADEGLTHKVLLGMPRGAPDEPLARTEPVESVLMLYPRQAVHGAAGDGTDDAAPRGRARATVCVSSQAGCAMGCPFCATGQAGYRGQLSTGEIVRQVTVMQRLLKRGGRGDSRSPTATEDDPRAHPGAGLPFDAPDHVTNVVFMGMGEPLANADAVLDAVRWLADGTDGFGLSARSITVSTVGLVPGMRRLTALGLPVTLAVSLHAPTDGLRDHLVPPNQHFPLTEVLSAAEAHAEATGRRLTFEYVLIDEVNDDPAAHARELARLVRDLPAHVNLIPMNPTPEVPWHAPPIARQRAFRDTLAEHGVTATIRHNRGGDIDAACGQLYATYAAGSGRTLPVAQGAADRVAALMGEPSP